MRYEVLKVLYPNWFYPTFFGGCWGLFFREEIFNLSFLLAPVFLWHFVSGLTFSCLAVNVTAVVLYRRFLAGGLCSSTETLVGKTVIVTGANVGIGKETARDLLGRGAHVILACRDMKKAEAAKQDIRGAGGRVEIRKLDLSSLESISSFAAGIIKDNIKVHILINNAGVGFTPYVETEDGFELVMGTNHLGHFLLTNLLLPQMRHGQPARIINVSSAAHLNGKIDFSDLYSKKRYKKFQAYSNSKLANVLFTRQLANILKGSNIQVFSVHPGAAATDFGRHVNSSSILKFVFRSLIAKTTMEGAQTTIYCATEARQHPEMYFNDCTIGWSSKDSKDEKLAEKLWTESAKLVGLDNEAQ